ncbi:MAG: hypothetical protein A3J24_00400 [Deltaproteobacteria bacterium RIFCSPLOWO2_02_FULL_53_8]|nr:MAG: hypothetical protein A3J24_00400 [Deltaproteobacteria bacterium RIFCSPLOWO2_02_FULL_53_8]
MKAWVAGISLAVVLVSGMVFAEPARKGTESLHETGRYRVETVEYEATGGVRGLYNRKLVVKIDTLTGKAWFLKDVPNKGIESSGTTRYWVEIDDYAAYKSSSFEAVK